MVRGTVHIRMNYSGHMSGEHLQMWDGLVTQGESITFNTPKPVFLSNIIYMQTYCTFCCSIEVGCQLLFGPRSKVDIAS